jgi:hypothetical protein
MLNEAANKINNYLEEKYGKDAKTICPMIITRTQNYFGVFRKTNAGRVMVYYDFKNRQVCEEVAE